MAEAKIDGSKIYASQVDANTKVCFDVIPNEYNIYNMMKSQSNVLDRKEIDSFDSIISMIETVNNISDEMLENNYTSKVFDSHHLIEYLFSYLVSQTKILYTNPKYALLLKAMFHEYIVEKRYYVLIDLYNTIYTDNLYSNIKNTIVFYPTLTQEWIKEKIEIYQNKCQQIKQRSISKYAPPKYEIDEIIGARDRENKWWMSRILDHAVCHGHTVYYVEFIGWGSHFNEFISDAFRLEKFNPRKHKYYRPQWKNKNIAYSHILNEE